MAFYRQTMKYNLTFGFVLLIYNIPHIFVGYVIELVEKVLQLREEYPSYARAERLAAWQPDTLTDDMDLVPREEIIARHRSRFNN